VSGIAGGQRTRIKFCGMTRAEDIAVAAALGVDAIGLIFAERSRRRLSLSQGRDLRRTVPPFVASVALSMDASITALREIIDIVRPDWLQFHGSEPGTDCARFGLPYLKAVPMADARPLAEWFAEHPCAAGFVLDAHASGEAGGSGQRFDWARVPLERPRPVLLAGGLEPDNVFDAIIAVRPYAVDVASGIEAAPGRKCPQRMQRFVAEVRRADAALQEMRHP